MKKITVALIIACMAILFSSCNKQQKVAENNLQSAQKPAQLTLLKSYAVGFSGNEFGTYMPQDNENGNIVAHYIDYQALQKRCLCTSENCAHDSESCVAYTGKSGNGMVRMFADNRFLFIFKQQIDTAGQIYIANLDGTNKKLLTQLADNEMTEYYGNIAIDNSYLYLFTVSYADNSRSLIKIEIETGNIVWQTALPLDISGAMNIGLISSVISQVVKDDIIILNHINGKDVINSINSQTGEIKDIAQIEESEYSSGNIFKDGFIYLTKANGINKIDLSTGEKTVITQSLPVENAVDYTITLDNDCENIAVYWRNKKTDSWEYYFYNPNTNTLTEKTLLAATNGRIEPLWVYGQTENDILVVAENRQIEKTNLGTGGEVFTSTYDVPCYALISKQDYNNNIPNYREITTVE